jgi:digeranylgeranylglycerophospholipid reductase
MDVPNATYVLERKVFDRVLTEMAANAGADIIVKARATGVRKDDNGCVNGIVFRHSARDYTVKTKVVIAADGIESQVVSIPAHRPT